MRKSVKNTYVSVNTYGGLDWHDISTWSNFLQEGGRFEIKDVFGTIAKHVYRELKKMRISSSNSEQATVLANIPSLKEITKCIRRKRTFTVTSEDGFELEACWNPKENTLWQYYYAGQISYSVSYDIKRIAPKNLIYIAAENFLRPMKGIPSVIRFYKTPFTSLKDAQKECGRIQTEIKRRDTESVRPELIIADKTKINKTEWYKYNMQVIKILAEHPELDNDCNFELTVTRHLEKLKEKIVA